MMDLIAGQEVSLRVLIADGLRRHEDGQDMIEYALLAALISIVAIIIILALGPYIQNAYQDVANTLAKT